MSQQKKGVLSLILALAVGICIGASAATLILTKQTAEILDFAQAAHLTEWEQASWEAYTREKPEIGAWALSNFISKVETSQEPPKRAAYSLFKGHARLAKLHSEMGNREFSEVHSNLAFQSLQQWASPQLYQRSNAVMETIQKIDREKARP